MSKLNDTYQYKISKFKVFSLINLMSFTYGVSSKKPKYNTQNNYYYSLLAYNRKINGK